MKIIVDYELCEGNARCMEMAPDIFHVDEEDKIHVLIESPSEDRRADVEAAIRLCPRQALSLQEG
jgi:ferredoxin